VGELAIDNAWMDYGHSDQSKMFQNMLLNSPNGVSAPLIHENDSMY